MATESTIQAGPHNREQLLQALDAVLSSNTFAEVYRLRKFLDYVVRETLAGNSDRLKGFVIACEVFKKDDPTDAQTTTVVRVEAGRLRRRLKDYYDSEGAGDPFRISIPKGGYSAAFEKAPRNGLQESSNRKPLSLKEVLNYALGTVMAAAVILLGTLYVISLYTDAPQETVLLPGNKPTIAVMPFQNLTGTPQGDAFAEGIAEDLCIDLGRSPDIDVISYSSAKSLHERQLPALQAARKLGAAYVLEGSLRALPPHTQLTARVSDTRTGIQLWAGRFEMEDDSDFVSVAAELAGNVASNLPIALTEAGRNVFGKSFTQNREAWYLYKQAMDLANPPSDPNRLNLALEAFGKVIAKDPEFAGGYAGSAYVKAFLIFFGHSANPEHVREEAITLIHRARELDHSFGLTFSALSFLHLSNRDFDRALRESEQAVLVQPNDAYISAYHGFIRGAGGDLEGGIPYVERALQLDPLNSRSPYLNILGTLSYLAGNIEVARDSFIASEKRGGPHGAGPMRILAAAHARLGETALAESILRKAEAMGGESAWRDWLFNTFKDPEGPQSLIDELSRIRARSENPAARETEQGP